MTATRLGTPLLLPLLTLLGGCQVFGALVYFLSPRQIVPPEFELAAGRVAIVVDFLRPGQENPVFARALADEVSDLFAQNNVPAEIVPHKELTDLRKTHPDFHNWSIQRIGRQLAAKQVLYIGVDMLRFRERPDHPVLTPYVSLGIKVIGTHETRGHERLWPTELEGKRIPCDRPAVEAVNPEVADAEAAKLARDTAQHVARLFFAYDEEDRLRPER